MIAAVPLLFMDVRVDPDDLAWRTARPWEWGKRFLYRWNDGDRLLFWGRLPDRRAGHGAGRRRLSLGAAAVGRCPPGCSPCCSACSARTCWPTGHSSPTTCRVVLFVFLSVVAFERLVERVTVRASWRSPLAVGAAFATKFSAFALPPILLALSRRGRAAARAARRRHRRARAKSGARAGSSLVLVAAVVVVGALALGVVWAAYGFQSALTPDPAVDAFMHENDAPPASAALRIGARLTRGRLLPEAWVWGFLNCFKSFASRPVVPARRNTRTRAGGTTSPSPSRSRRRSRCSCS